MENVTDGQVDQTPEAGSNGGSEPEVKKPQTVAYESFDKAVAQTKAMKKKNEELQAELDKLKLEEQKKKGDLEGVIKKLETDLNETKNQLSSERKQNMWEKVTGAISAEAGKHKCHNANSLIKLLGKSDFEMLKSEDGTINQEGLTNLMEKAKKEHSYLFGAVKVETDDLIPDQKAPVVAPATEDEIFENYIATIKD